MESIETARDHRPDEDEPSLHHVTLLRSILDREDWKSLFDHLADDVVFEVTIPDGTPISGEFRGKRAVIEHFKNLGNIAEFRQEQPPEYFSRGDRVVVLGKESFEVKKSSVTVRGSQYVEIVDFRDGLITRFLVIQDLSAFVEAYRSH
jgi:ketosteroid isomerase-like protein